jgi:predicted signal transduction protein with EAL and GGDEF domain
MITASIGVALYDSERESVEDLVARADGAMYEAKLLGRNQVVLSSYEPGSNRSSGIRLAGEPFAPTAIQSPDVR